MKSLEKIFNILGYLLVISGFFLIIPLVYSLFENSFKVTLSFAIPSFISILTGSAMIKFFKKGKLTLSQSMIVCSLGWILISIAGAIPFVLGLDKSLLDSILESVSGFTTTGTTMLSNLDSIPKSIILWRSLSQWFGGLGIITFFIAISSKLQGAHKLFGAESHKVDSGRPVPGLLNTVKILLVIYVIFTTMIFLLLLTSGMSLFDSLNHSFTTLSTGGFSPHDSSIAYYTLNGFKYHIFIEYIIIFGMILGGINFLVHYHVLKGRINQFWKNFEIRYFWGIILVSVIIILLETSIKTEFKFLSDVFQMKFWRNFELNFRLVLFQVVSILTTTGFTTKDISNPYFGFASKQMFLILMFIGGCVGSTSGGFKVLRVALLNKIYRKEIFKIFLPRKAIKSVYIEGKLISNEEIQRVISIFFIWISFLLIGGIITSLFSDYNSISSISGMFSALGNIGPSYIPTEDISNLNPLIKIIYIFGMLAGRLEIFPIIILFNRKAWI